MQGGVVLKFKSDGVIAARGIEPDFFGDFALDAGKTDKAVTLRTPESAWSLGPTGSWPETWVRGGQ